MKVRMSGYVDGLEADHITSETTPSRLEQA